MESDRWQRLWALFHGALERPAGAEREAFLRVSCSDDGELRREPGPADEVSPPSPGLATALP